MANLFHDERAMRWWLPDDKGFSSMLQSIRNFADERHNVAPNGQLDYGHALGRVFGELALGGDIAR